MPQQKLQPERTPLSTLFDWLSRPGAATSGAVLAAQQLATPLTRSSNLTGQRKDSFDDVLTETGMEQGPLRSALGFAGDVVADPINLIPGGALMKGAKGIGKVAGAGLAKVGLDAPMRGLDKAFVRYYGLPDSYADARRLLQSENTWAREKAGTKPFGGKVEKRKIPLPGVKKGRWENLGGDGTPEGGFEVQDYGTDITSSAGPGVATLWPKGPSNPW